MSGPEGSSHKEPRTGARSHRAHFDDAPNRVAARGVVVSRDRGPATSRALARVGAAKGKDFLAWDS